MTMDLQMKVAVRTAVLLIAVFVLGACGSVEESESVQAVIQVEEIPGSDVSRITLSSSAVDRLDIQTVSVESWTDGFVVPSAAVIIDPDGVYWVYTSPDPYVFVREKILNAHEESLKTYFETGPNVGMAVVTVGVPELYGAEVGIGK